MGDEKISHCFNLSGTEDPILDGMPEVFKAYKKALAETTLAGPTYFAGILQAFLDYANQSSNL